MYTLGFIGCGNMAQAMIRGALKSGFTEPEQIVVSARTEKTRAYAHQEFGIAATASNAEVFEKSEIVILAVKPQVYETVLYEAAAMDTVSFDDKLLVGIAPGKTIAWLAERWPGKKIARLMPNTPAAVGEGMTAVALNDFCNKQDEERIHALVASFGRCLPLPESLFDAVVTASGSSPAYVYMFIEAMADAAVLEGMPRAQAYECVAQAVLGSAKMVLESGQHPAALKDAVCSPGGTTIEGVRVLEENGFRGSVMAALHACAEKARTL